ncbi:MAG: DUF5615 family PIN-like protein [Calothrix sp. MO_192.B10]|nr:DUF5615 family PIN-like protein [Calothrix sp. MO_192.B10]
MTQKIRFHLDENVSNAIAEGLRRRGIDVTTTPETGLIAASDAEQVAFAHSGIAYCTQNRRSIGEILTSLILIWEILEPEEMRNQLEFL